MSHFTVLVAARNQAHVDDLLAPYYEQYGPGDEEARRNGWIEYVDQYDELWEEYNNGSIRVVRLPDGSVKLRYDEEFRNPLYDPIRSIISVGPEDTPQFIYPEGSELLEMTPNEVFATFEEYNREYRGYDPEEPLGYWHNPNSKWDWYQIGGRWPNILLFNEKGVKRTREQGSADARKGQPSLLWEEEDLKEIYGDDTSGCVALAGEVDWEGMMFNIQQSRRELHFDYHISLDTAAQEWQSEQELAENYVRERRLRFSEYSESPSEVAKNWNENYFAEGERGQRCREVFPTLHDYEVHQVAEEITERRRDAFMLFDTWDEIEQIRKPLEEYMEKYQTPAQTFAFVDQEGNWVERGNMGWWGMVSDRQDGYDQAWWKFVQGLDENQPVFVVDCHI